MLKVLLLFVLLIAGIVVGPMIAGHQGYVLIQTDNYNIETSVTGLAIILILAMVVLFAIEWLLRRIFRTGAHTRGWFVGRKRRRARKQTEQALLKLAEGDYQQVEKLMAKNADHAEQPVVNYLLAAGCASRLRTRVCISFSSIAWLCRVSGRSIEIFCWLNWSTSSRNALVVASSVS